MKKIFLNSMLATVLLISSLFIPSCTDLEEVPLDKTTQDVLQQDTTFLPNLVAPALGQLKLLWWRQSFWGMQESNSDELMFPTRGTDWFDGGVWVEQWLHTWTPVHRDVGGTWNELNQAIASANFGLSILGTETVVSETVKEYRAVLKFLRDFYMYCLIDLYGIAPYRDPFSVDYLSQPEYWKRPQAFNFIINDVKSLLDDLSDRSTAVYGVPSRDAAYMLLAKLYLNKEVYLGQPAYDSCLLYLNQIIDPGNYQLADNYFGIFGPENHLNYKQQGDEAILVACYNDDDKYLEDNHVIWIQHTFHYSQSLMGKYTAWNGCVAPEGYLNECWFTGTDTSTDVRWVDSTIYPGMAVVNGFNYGQQYNIKGKALAERQGAPLIFTFNCPLEGATESQGVRVLKYAPSMTPLDISRVQNDFVIWRFADALLMKAECLARVGDMGQAMDIVNQIREKRKAPLLTSMELIDILRERGRELYWEGHRRQDMIRFGTFLLPKTNKDYTSPETALLIPIPQTALVASEGLLLQNDGY